MIPWWGWLIIGVAIFAAVVVTVIIAFALGFGAFILRLIGADNRGRKPRERR